jgi:hypothetical protein
VKKWLMIGLSVIAFQAIAQQAFAQQEHLESLPGYVDFGDLTDVYGDPKVMINIGGNLLKLVQAAAHDDPEAAAVLGGLLGVRINVYLTAGDLEPALEQVNRVKDLLSSSNWEPFVQVRETRETVDMYLKTDDEGVQGMLVMSVDESEAVFINILGSISPDALDGVMNQLDTSINSLE